MLIIIDKKMPAIAKKRLAKYGNIMELGTNGITYEAISGHPDIFFCKTRKNTLIAPNLPTSYKKILNENRISYVEGYAKVGMKYPFSAKYNAFADETIFVHNLEISDSILLEKASTLKMVNVKQGYCRCNLVGNKNCYLTSDLGIFEVLKRLEFNVHYIDPSNIVLPGFKNGFFGGCCGIQGDKLFVNGKLSSLEKGSQLTKTIEKHFQIIELHDGPLIDVGSIIFL